MKWVTKDYKGQEQIWYSEDEFKTLCSMNEVLINRINKVKDIVENGCYPEFDWLFNIEMSEER